MKKLALVLVILIVSGFTIPTLAKESVLPSSVNKTNVEENLMAGLASENTGLQRSCALMLGEIQSDRAVIPLMETLRNHSDENVRIAAAWALCTIGDVRGIYAVKMAINNDESTRVKITCAWYFENLREQGTFTSTRPELRGITSE